MLEVICVEKNIRNKNTTSQNNARKENNELEIVTGIKDQQFITKWIKINIDCLANNRHSNDIFIPLGKLSYVIKNDLSVKQ